MQLSKVVSEIILTLITILLLIFIGFFYLPKINNEYLNAVEKVIDEIHFRIINNDFESLKMINIPPDSIIALWLKKEQNNWLPILVMENYNQLSKEGPVKLPVTFSYKIIKYNTKKSHNIEYYAWINRFNYQFIVKKLLILILLISISYIALIIIIELLFLPLTSSILTKGNKSENYTKINDEEILNEYKELWNKNFKVSEQFKKNPNFLDIYKKMSLTVTMEDYLEFCSKKFKELFKVEEANFFINKKGLFDIKNKCFITKDNINIATDTQNKGDIYIPLFPYKIKNIFGYFYFKWEKDENFNINEIFYFLKFIFSYKIKPVLLFAEKIKKLIKIITETLIKNPNLTICLIIIDKLEYLFNKLNINDQIQLNNKIKSLLLKKISKINLIQIDLFYYLIITKKDKEELTFEISQFISEEDNQVFEIDKEKENIAITYSVSVVSSKNRKIHSLPLIKECEDLLKQAEQDGGNKVLCQ